MRMVSSVFWESNSQISIKRKKKQQKENWRWGGDCYKRRSKWRKQGGIDGGWGKLEKSNMMDTQDRNDNSLPQEEEILFQKN